MTENIKVSQQHLKTVVCYDATIRLIATNQRETEQDRERGEKKTHTHARAHTHTNIMIFWIITINKKMKNSA
jgi:hypothetical protein